MHSTQVKARATMVGSHNSYLTSSQHKPLNQQSRLHGKTFNSEQKFLHHFQTINHAPNYTNVKFNSDSKNVSHQKEYIQKMQAYQTLSPSSKNATSIVDRIIETVEVSNNRRPNLPQKADSQLRFVSKPAIIPVQHKLRDKILKINRFFAFNGIKNSQQHENQVAQSGTAVYATYKSQVSNEKSLINQKLDDIEIYDLNQYAKTLSALPRRNKRSSQQIFFSTERHREAQINTDPVDPESVQNRNGTLRKIDILLIEILREKKRRGLVDDYFKVMQMKLIELLDYILEDQPEYLNQKSTLVQKMKEVLRNLEKFKGKLIEGEPKVNLLRIFFQEFRNLKQEREKKETYSQIHGRGDENYAGSPGKMVEKQFHPINQVHYTEDGRQKTNSREEEYYEGSTNKKQYQKALYANPADRSKQSLKAKINYHQTMSMGGSNRNKKQKISNPVEAKNKKGAKSVRGGEQQWIGELV